MKKRKIVVRDTLQKHYIYFLTELQGKHFHPDFIPELTPKQMLELGVFGGLYLYDCQKEFPKTWFTKAKMTQADVTVEKNHNAALNFFKVNASQPLAVWKKKDWLSPHDPRGWFQWYCRYYAGRRLPQEDLRQIKRWKAIARHVAQVKKNCLRADITCRPVQRQALLHWAYDSRNI